MRLERFKARVRRNNFESIAGEFYQGEDSPIVLELRGRGKKALLGVQRTNGVYTILGEGYVFYSNRLGLDKEISLDKLVDALVANTENRGKGAGYEFIQVTNDDTIWVLSEEFMYVMWNIIQFLQTELDNQEKDSGFEKINDSNRN